MQQTNTMQLLKIQKSRHPNANTLDCKKDSTPIQSKYLSAKCGKTKQIFTQRSKKQKRRSIISGSEEEVGYFKKEQSYPAKLRITFYKRGIRV